MPGPLTGVKVVDLSAVLSGPLATMVLADQGADVIKVEPPGIGDVMRLSPFSRGGLGAFFANTNRGKRSIVIDLQQDEGRELLLRLCEDADVFVQNFRPGAAERLGVGEAAVRERSPDVVYVSISGFGESGPYAGRRVYDPVIQALTGHMAIQRRPDAPEEVDLVRQVICDKASAWTACQAITAALFARERGAGGQHLRMSMLDAGLFFLWPDGMMAHTFTGEGVTPGPTLYDLYELTRTRDGNLIYFAITDAEYHGLYRALGRAEWIEDPRFGTIEGRTEHRDALLASLAEAFATFATTDILARMEAEELPVAPVKSLEQVIDDPQVRHDGTLLERDHPSAGALRQPRPPGRFEKTPAEAGLPPLLGEHTDEILAGLGVDAASRARLREKGTVA